MGMYFWQKLWFPTPFFTFAPHVRPQRHVDTTGGVSSVPNAHSFDTMNDFKSRQVQFGLSVRAARASRGLSQRALALMIGTTQSYVWRLESGRINPTLEIQCRLADALEVSVRSLIEF